MECEICKTGMTAGVTLYRTNPKGSPAIWRCRVCVDVPPDMDLEQLAKALSDTHQDI